jgi:UDP-N-acetylmuramoyl-L-alanyl-D-glutamate--2,6-diaminopimelate ligase
MSNELLLSDVLGLRVPILKIRDIHWKSQESTEDAILFYKIGDEAQAEQLFSQRIINSKFAWLVVNRSIGGLPSNASVVNEQEWPQLQKQILDFLYPLPPLKLIGITGTNGKTTTTDLVLQLGKLVGKKGLSIGTLGVREVGKTLLDFGLTSPSLIDLRKFLFQFGFDKDFCVMEASSHALVQERLHGISFDSAGWLSFSQDHLDYHKTMEEYFRAKCIILNKLNPASSLFVPKGQKELLHKLKTISEKVQESSVIQADLPLFFRTKFNRENLEVAWAIVQQVFPGSIVPDWNLLQPPDGRFYIRNVGTNYIVVDFAHTPDALENICQGIRETFPQHRLKVLFGCGGDRDRSKRPKMAEVVSRWADEIYVTSDNPRSEDPEQIIRDVVGGIEGRPFQTITDRPTAVQSAFKELKEKEVLLLAGKGHEDYILINGVKHPYSDIRQVDEFIARTKT